jgi:S1-C subfamily serine protease
VSNAFANLFGRQTRLYAYVPRALGVAPVGTRLILSNNHVLANSNEGAIEDSIYQPGPYDGGREVDKIGTLLRFVKIDFSGGYNTVDCALALPLNDDLVTEDILQIGRVAGVRESVTVGTTIKKSGRTTEFTTGPVLMTDVTVQVDYGGPIALFEGQILGGPMSAGGDSGSLCLDESNMAVGLLFAGSDTVTIFNPISEVLRLLGVTF